MAAYNGKLFRRNVKHGVKVEGAPPVQVDYLPDGRSVSFESRFGWHDVDVRIPLPSLTALHEAEHPIGLQNGRRVYLCTARTAMRYGHVERSAVFSEHYGVQVYLCRRG